MQGVNENGISEIEKTNNSSRVAGKQAETLALLYENPEIDRMLGRVAFDFRQDKDDLKQQLALKIVVNADALCDIEFPNAWLLTTIKNYCRNEFRHRKVENAYSERTLSESVQCRRCGGTIVVQRSTTATPEDLLIEKTKNLPQPSQELQLKLELLKMLDSLPPETLRIARLSLLEGQSPNQISHITGKAPATVYRALKKFSKTLKKVGAENNVLEDQDAAARVWQQVVEILLKA